MYYNAQMHRQWIGQLLSFIARRIILTQGCRAPTTSNRVRPHGTAPTVVHHLCRTAFVCGSVRYVPVIPPRWRGDSADAAKMARPLCLRWWRRSMRRPGSSRWENEFPTFLRDVDGTINLARNIYVRRLRFRSLYYCFQKGCCEHVDSIVVRA